MRIVVLIKQVPDTDDVKLDPEKGTMIREGTGNIINPLDLNALQAAVEIKAVMKPETRITAVSMGPLSTEYALREAMALGADDCLLLTDRRFAGADSWSTAKVLSCAIKEIGEVDIILAGEKATDGETGQVGPEVAAMLNIPFSTYISDIKPGENKVTVTRTVEDGYELQRIDYPCLMTVISAINNPGMPTLEGKMRARRAAIKRMSADELRIDEKALGLKGSPTRVVKVTTPKKTRQTRLYSGSSIDEGIGELIEVLEAKGLL